uniref:Cadherin domain-containing protein n=1 Tax=Chrysemys picta bellii TaxID=8478 RepID=A0A8C3FJX8_CHRPI
MAGGMENRSRKRQVLSFFLCLCVSLGACETIRYSVPEEKKSGSLVTNIAKDLKLDVGKLSGRSARLVSKNTKEYFELNTGSGDVIIKEKIDREDLCGQSDPCLLQFEIVLENPLQLYRIEVQIEDMNDNSPKFSKNEFPLELPEQLPVNSRFPLERAQDSDIGTNGIQSYAISSNEHFSLDVHSRGDGSKYAELVLEKQLDREAQAQLMLILTAADGGLPQRTGTALIRINVLDNNDNFPQFSQSVYKVQLMENSPRDTLVTKVEASDLDQGSNAEITYSFRQVPDRFLKLFKLNQSSGEIAVMGLVDYEERSSYEMNIQATDGGGLYAHCKVLVQIEDMNDNAPEVKLTSLTGTIPEDSAPESVVALFSVRDRDSGDNGRTLCSIQDNVPFALKSTLKDYYQLVTQKPLDREKQAQLMLILTAADGGLPQRTSTALIRVNVLDNNDNFPQFSQSVYKVQLMENSPRDTLVIKVEASDLDQGSNAEITYSFGQVSDKVLELFQLNQFTGEITVLGIIDFEDAAMYEIEVLVTDGGGLSAHCKVLVQIEDMNDNPPEVTVTSLTGTIPEDSSPETVVALFSVRDRDSGDNGRTLCSIQDNVPFALTSTLKDYYELVTQKPLDREKVPEYNITITATDRGTPRLTSVRIIRVQLSDINDNPPLFNESSYVMSLKENNHPGLLIGTVHAADVDTEQNAKVTYSKYLMRLLSMLETQHCLYEQTELSHHAFCLNKRYHTLQTGGQC